MAKHQVKLKCSKCNYEHTKTSSNLKNFFDILFEIGALFQNKECPNCRSELKMHSTLNKKASSLADRNFVLKLTE